MDANKEPTTYTEDGVPRSYMDIQAALGVSKHIGGYPATDELYRLCHLSQAHDVLEVGCGIGSGPVYTAQRFGCRVTAVDLSPQMLAWARRRAEKAGVAHLITLRQANVLELPFADDSFDAAIVESVLGFVGDKARAISELTRVVRPGGYVGLNESFWVEAPPEETLNQWETLGSAVITLDAWRAIWAQTPLIDRVIQERSVDPRQEMRDRMRWIGWRNVWGIWARTIKLMLSSKASRESLKSQMDTPKEVLAAFGYGLFVGRKPNGDTAAEGQ